MASPRATVAIAVVLVVALLATLAVGTDVLPSPIGPDRIEGTPEPFDVTTATTTTGPGATTTATAPASATAPATTSASTTATATTDESVADALPPTAPPPTATPSTTPAATRAGVTTTETSGASGVATATADRGPEPVPTTPATTESAATATPGATPADRLYERARVSLVATNGTRLATVRTWIADTGDKRYTGLSNTGSLANGTGMLFVYGGESHRTYVMRDMDYPLDIAFIGADRRINQIMSAPAPDPGQDGEGIRRSGSAKWVLEVPRGWLNATGVEEGDRIAVDRSS